MSGAIDYGVLGPLQVRRDGVVVPLAGAKPRAVLAMLLLEANHVVSAHALIDGLWGDDPPDTAAAALHVHVSKLRQALGTPADAKKGPIATVSPGYVIALDLERLDLTRFRALVTSARDAEPDRASELLADALAVWRGPALADLVLEPFAVIATRLEEERLAALERRVAADLACGRHGELVGEVYELVARHPMREQLWTQLVLALYRSGRQGDALAACARARSILLDELGVDPGAELRALERDVLEQAPSLDWDSLPHAVQESHTTIFDGDESVAVAHLVVAGRTYFLRTRTTLGRDARNTVVIDDPKVSREHAVITADGNRFLLRDLGSTNGTLIDDVRVREYELSDGDCLTFGNSEVVFRIGPA